MEIIAGYILIGVVMSGAYRSMSAFSRLTYAFVFPIHWVLLKWVLAIQSGRGKGVLHNEPLWGGLFLIFLILTLLCGS